MFTSSVTFKSISTCRLQPLPVILLLQLLHLTLQEQQLLAGDGRDGGVGRVAATQLLPQGAILHLQGGLLLGGHRQLQGEAGRREKVWRTLRTSRRVSREGRTSEKK